MVYPIAYFSDKGRNNWKIKKIKKFPVNGVVSERSGRLPVPNLIEYRMAQYTGTHGKHVLRHLPLNKKLQADDMFLT